MEKRKMGKEKGGAGVNEETKGIRTYLKTYGIQAGFEKGQPRFFVVCDGKRTSLHYARAEFAMKEAHDFVRRCYKPFVDFQGYQVQFQFERAR